jgi:predicted dehydrogenase
VNRLRIAVAGAGLIGRRHVELIQASAEATLAAIADPAPAARALAESLGTRLYPGLAQLLQAERPEGVIVATPNRMHVADGIACIERGVPALIEKPIADSVDEALRLANAAATAKVPLLIGHHRRYSPILTCAREVVAAGTLGRLVAVSGSATFYKPDRYFAEGPWRAQPGGGPILINMIHEVDDLRALCGDIVAVQASASNATRGFAVEDTVAITLRFANGALGSFMLSDTAASPRSWEQTAAENPSYAHYADEDCYVLSGTRGSLGVPTMRLRTYPAEPSWWQPFDTRVIEVRRDDPLALQLAHFCAVIRGEVAPRVTAREGLETLRVTLGIDRAAKTGVVVDTASRP